MGKRILLALGIVVAIVGIAFAMQRILFGGEPEATPSAAPSASQGTGADAGAPQRIVLGAATGKVERRAPNGQWQVLKVGDEVNPNDQIRTGPEATARLDLGDAVSVNLAEETQLNVAELSSTLSRIRLDDGRIVSEVKGSRGYRFRVNVKGSDAVAETGRGKFAVLRRGEEGAITVAAQEGSVNVSAQDQGVRVEAGQQSIVAPGAAPTPPSKIPSSLLLKIGRPPPSRMRKKQASVSGATNPGATVVINGVSTTAGADGSFTRAVTLQEGANDIVVVVEDAVGRRKEAELPKITVDSRPPNVRGKVEW